jgi:VCBS repeat-containing protein
VVEDAPVASGSIVMFDSGTVTVSDVDSDEDHFQQPASLDGNYGSFTFDINSGEWTYQADADKVQSLGQDITATDTLTVTSFDGTASKDIVVTITGTNDAPVFGGHDLTATYEAGGAAVALVDTVTASDIDSDHYAGGTLTATVIDSIPSGDTLSIASEHAWLVASGTTVMYDADGIGGADAIEIGTLSNYDYNSLTVTLNADADDAAVAALTQAIKFSNSTENPAAGTRTVAFTLHDGGGTANNGHDSDYFEAHVTVAAPEVAAATGPVIQTDLFTVSENHDNGTTTVAGLYVTDPDDTVPDNDGFTLLATTGAPEPAQSSVDPSSSSGYLSDINATLRDGVTYNPGDDNQPDTDSVTFTVTDGLGHSDTVNFIFNQAGQPGVTLTGTDGKDVLFATGETDDILTGGANADQFVFKIGDGNDTITDFATGQDHIDLRRFADFVDTSNINVWLREHASQTNPTDVLITLDTNDTITLKNVALSHLTANDFILHPGGGHT